MQPPVQLPGKEEQTATTSVSSNAPIAAGRSVTGPELAGRRRLPVGPNITGKKENGPFLEIAPKRLEKSIQQYPRIAEIFGVVILFLLALTLYLAYVARRRAREIEMQMKAMTNLMRHLERAHDEALQGLRLKSEFVANISHEIRTPMSAVLGSIGLLFDTKLDSKQYEIAEVLRESARSLMAVINDILDFSKIEAGKMQLNSLDFSPEVIVYEIADMFRANAEEKGLVLEKCVDPDIPSVVRGDAFRLRQILLNLIGNAVKFTNEGSITISARRVIASAEQDQDEGNATLRFSVKDTGIGLSDEAKLHLFQPFVQADGSTTRQFGGTGLGLSISQRLAQMMGGEITVESEVGKGSEFVLLLPFATGQNVPPPQLPPVSSKPYLAPAKLFEAPEEEIVEAVQSSTAGIKRILVVEDSQVLRRIVKRQLESLNLNITIDLVNNGLEAVQAAQTGNYSFIFMDWQMPEMDGLQATRQIRDTVAGGKDIPIIAMTANAMEGDRDACLAAGMNDYISKPFTVTQLKSVMERYLGDLSK